MPTKPPSCTMHSDLLLYTCAHPWLIYPGCWLAVCLQHAVHTSALPRLGRCGEGRGLVLQPVSRSPRCVSINVLRSIAPPAMEGFNKIWIGPKTSSLTVGMMLPADDSFGHTKTRPIPGTTQSRWCQRSMQAFSARLHSRALAASSTILCHQHSSRQKVPLNCTSPRCWKHQQREQ